MRLPTLKQSSWQRRIALKRDLQQSAWDALRRGTGPLKRPREEYVPLDVAAALKRCEEREVKLAIYQGRLKAENPDGRQMLVLEAELEQTPVRGKKY